MAKQLVEHRTTLLKLQSQFGQAETGLAAEDAAEVLLDAVKMTTSVSTNSLRFAGGRGSPNKSLVTGASKTEVEISYPMKNGDTATPGQWTLPLLCSGFKKDSQGALHTFTPTYLLSEMKDCTVWQYSGNNDNDSSILREADSCQFDCDIILDWTKGDAFGRANFTGKGKSDYSPVLATKPTISKTSVGAYSITGANVSMFGPNYDPLNITFHVKRGPELLISHATGYSGTLLTAPAAITWEAVVYKDSGALAESDLRSGTLGTISAAWGAAPGKITVGTGSQKAKITEVSHSEQDGVELYELKGEVVDNDFYILCDCDAIFYSHIQNTTSREKAARIWQIKLESGGGMASIQDYLLSNMDELISRDIVLGVV